MHVLQLEGLIRTGVGDRLHVVVRDVDLHGRRLCGVFPLFAIGAIFCPRHELELVLALHVRDDAKDSFRALVQLQAAALGLRDDAPLVGEPSLGVHLVDGTEEVQLLPRRYCLNAAGADLERVLHELLHLASGFLLRDLGFRLVGDQHDLHRVGRGEFPVAHLQLELVLPLGVNSDDRGVLLDEVVHAGRDAVTERYAQQEEGHDDRLHLGRCLSVGEGEGRG